MLARIALLLNRCKPIFVWILKAGTFFVMIGLAVLLFELRVWPWITKSEPLKQLGILPAWSERVMIVERRESVTVTQDENLERLAAEHVSIVVSLLELPDQAPGAPSQRSQSPQRFSGTLVTNDGLIVTYTERAPLSKTRYAVWLSDGTQQEATFVGYDTLTNLSYFRMNRGNTPAAAFANARDVKPGRRVVLLGVTHEIRPTLISTAIESVDRTFNLSPQTIASSEKWEGVLKLAPEVHADYVGGPALLSNGEIAGIVGVRRFDNQTQSFLIPTNVVRESLDRIIAGNLSRPMTGVYYLSLTPPLGVALNVSRDRGAIVYSPSERTGLSVIAGSPAARAGLQFGDIIIAVNGAEINLDLPLSAALGRLSVGETATLLVIRSGVEREISLSL